ncbi:unnamed protein product [Effrenium voratum]|uniref:Protein kinase domain-containing protein n=1 Tax=Effrenium voratum TaxID=2562239 RepID=A0AA36NBC4_9DINO|nr:unnamed protein product [Effrenium voratum]CAJ1443937.1 unnamed protein product [Effrenium voratum]
MSGGFLPVLLGHVDDHAPTQSKPIQEPDEFNAKVADDNFQLYQACASGDPVNAKRLLLAKVDANSKDYGGRTPLHLACGCEFAGAKEVVQLLLDHGADANALDKIGMTPMDISVKTGNRSIRKVLEASGVELQSALEQKARESSWLLKSSDFKLRKELGNTLKSVVHLADWNGTTVVVKCIKMKHRVVMKKLRKSQSLCLSLDNDELEALDGPTELMVPTKSEPEIVQACTEELLHEIQLLSSLRHPDLVLFLGACLEPDLPAMFVTEYMPKGDLEHYLFDMRRKKQTPHYAPPLWQTLEWSLAIARALAFLHNFPVVHRDLKPLNLLLTKTLDVKVTDFGISKIMAFRPEEGPMNMKRANSSLSTMTLGVGTYTYMAPEVVRTHNYTEKVDIYSFALIMFYLSSGKRPFYTFAHPSDILDRFVAGAEPRPDAGECHKVLRPLIQECWHKKSEDRPSAEDILVTLQEMKATSSWCGLSKVFKSGR